ncbi:nitric oxide synthase oxygenase [Sorangium sp. So ce513]|uniref:nitric oxide synthase oxygenase n=1 Tax=Sorangium sp. So ce513 TaxID=3133315 RepID=UPI003F63B582
MSFLKIVCSEPTNELASFLQALPFEPAEPVIALVLSTADLAYPLVAARTFLASAKESGASHLLWVAPYLPATTDVGRQIRDAEAFLRASGHRLTVVSHGPLLSALDLWRDDIRLRRALPLPLGDGALPWVAPADVARIALRALEQPGLTPPVVCGPAACTGAQVAAALSRAVRLGLASERFAWRRFEEIDRDHNRALSEDELLPYLTGLGVPADEARALRLAADTTGDGTLDFEEFTAGLRGRLDNLVQQLLREDSFEIRYVDTPAEVAVAALVRAGLRKAAAEALIEGWAALMREGVPGGAAGGDGADEVWLELPPASVDAWAERRALDYVNVHLLPGQGLLSLREGLVESSAVMGALAGKAAAISKVVDSSGRILALFRALDGTGVSARWLDAPPASLRWVVCGDRDKRRALLVSDGQLVGLHVEGEWQGLPSAMRLLMARAPLPGWQVATFRELGELKLDQPAALFEPEEVVCNCAGVKRGQIASLIEAGCESRAALSERTRAGQICGGCVPAIDEMFGASSLVQAEVKGARELAPGIFQIRLAPVGGAPAASVPGQHVLVQGYLDRRWVARAYTLSAPAVAGGEYEITVKREELGVFSRWLCERAASSLLRASAPRGSFVLPGPPVERVVFLAGGIGVTPAMAMLRALDGRAAGSGVGAFLLDWSASRAGDFVYFGEELRAIAGRTPGVAFRLRATRSEGRLSRGEVAELYPYRPGSRALVCGPEGFMRDAHEHLRAAGWPEDAIQRELFTSNVDAAGAIRPTPIRRAGAVRVAGGVCPVEHASFRLTPTAPEAVLTEAEAFLRQCYAELGVPSAAEERWKEVRASLEQRGTYDHLPDELAYGARLAWRNSSRCIGRFFWSTLQVRDMRHLRTEEEIFGALVEHMDLATNGGDIRAMMTVFRPGEPRIRIWNGQLIRYAGYRLPDGGVLGDPANVELTEQALSLGWPGGERTRFDLLPLIIQIGDARPRWFELPRERVLEVSIEHPRYAWFAELGLKWHALPAVSSMAFDVGGVQYTAAPFNGFYMGTEIGARNLSDVTRYNQLPLIADRLGLDRSRSDTLWQDAALVELNVAVLHSFRQARVRMLDHHALSEYFKKFEQQERECGRPVYADWTWIVPPMSASTMAVFHTDMENRILKPNYFYQDDPWKPRKG